MSFFISCTINIFMFSSFHAREPYLQEKVLYRLFFFKNVDEFFLPKPLNFIAAIATISDAKSVGINAMSACPHLLKCLSTGNEKSFIQMFKDEQWVQQAPFVVWAVIQGFFNAKGFVATQRNLGKALQGEALCCEALCRILKATVFT